MNDILDSEGELYEAKEDLRMERMYRRGWLTAALICIPAGLYLIPVADAAGGNTGKVYGLLCFCLTVAGLISAVGVMVQTFYGVPNARRIVDRRQREYDKQLVREAGL